MGGESSSLPPTLLRFGASLLTPRLVSSSIAPEASLPCFLSFGLPGFAYQIYAGFCQGMGLHEDTCFLQCGGLVTKQPILWLEQKNV